MEPYVQTTELVQVTQDTDRIGEVHTMIFIRILTEGIQITVGVFIGQANMWQ